MNVTAVALPPLIEHCQHGYESVHNMLELCRQRALLEEEFASRLSALYERSRKKATLMERSRRAMGSGAKEVFVDASTELSCVQTAWVMSIKKLEAVRNRIFRLFAVPSTNTCVWKLTLIDLFLHRLSTNE